MAAFKSVGIHIRSGELLTRSANRLTPEIVGESLFLLVHKMARIRTIKPEFFTSSDIVSLTPLSRLFYVALWCEADREGRLNWNLGTFKLRYFPAENCNIQDLADELIQAGLVEVYCIDDKNYAEIPTFKSHQVINNREADSVLPPRVKVACKRDSGEGRKEGRERKGTHVKEWFEEFYLAYPRKVAKQDAVKAWEKINPDLEKKEKIMIALSQAINSDDWVRDDGRFVPYPASWLNGRRWEDMPMLASVRITKPEGWVDPRWKGAK